MTLDSRWGLRDSNIPPVIRNTLPAMLAVLLKSKSVSFMARASLSEGEGRCQPRAKMAARSQGLTRINLERKNRSDLESQSKLDLPFILIWRRRGESLCLRKLVCRIQNSYYLPPSILL